MTKEEHYQVSAMEKNVTYSPLVGEAISMSEVLIHVGVNTMELNGRQEDTLFNTAFEKEIKSCHGHTDGCVVALLLPGTTDRRGFQGSAGG